MALRKGQEFSVSYNGTAIGKLTDISLSVDGNQINTANFDSGEWDSFLLGRKTATIDITARYDEADTTGQGAVYDDLAAGNTGTFVFGPPTPTTGDITYSGTGSASNVTFGAADEDVAEFSASIQISGTLTKATAT